MFHSKKRCYEKPFQDVTKTCKNRDFPPEELEKFGYICVDQVHIALQHPVSQ